MFFFFPELRDPQIPDSLQQQLDRGRSLKRVANSSAAGTDKTLFQQLTSPDAEEPHADRLFRSGRPFLEKIEVQINSSSTPKPTPLS